MYLIGATSAISNDVTLHWASKTEGKHKIYVADDTTAQGQNVSKLDIANVEIAKIKTEGTNTGASHTIDNLVLDSSVDRFNVETSGSGLTINGDINGENIYGVHLLAYGGAINAGTVSINAAKLPGRAKNPSDGGDEALVTMISAADSEDSDITLNGLNFNNAVQIEGKTFCNGIVQVDAHEGGDVNLGAVSFNNGLNHFNLNADDANSSITMSSLNTGSGFISELVLSGSGSIDFGSINAKVSMFSFQGYTHGISNNGSLLDLTGLTVGGVNGENGSINASDAADNFAITVAGDNTKFYLHNGNDDVVAKFASANAAATIDTAAGQNTITFDGAHAKSAIY